MTVHGLRGPCNVSGSSSWDLMLFFYMCVDLFLGGLFILLKSVTFAEKSLYIQHRQNKRLSKLSFYGKVEEPSHSLYIINPRDKMNIVPALRTCVKMSLEFPSRHPVASLMVYCTE